MYDILKLNEISPLINDILKDNYNITDTSDSPKGIILRSFKMHDYAIPNSLIAVARAGAGVNNIPIDKMTEKGICVFNTPGANANAVKELVLCAMLLASRDIYGSINWTNSLNTSDDVPALVEKGKKAFIGPELSGKKLGVIGLGAIGRMVANAAVGLEMKVMGYDPFISVDGAWSLSRAVEHVKDIKQIFAECDYITLHVPLTKDTNNLINNDTISMMKNSAVIINCSRGELVNNADIIAACEAGRVAKYVTDFPCAEVLNKKNIITIPHLGASTPEAEDNCAVMAAKELKDYIENGNITNSVNFPSAYAPRSGKARLTILHKNVSNMISQATNYLSARHINIGNMVCSSKGEIAYMIIDIDSEIDVTVAKELEQIDGYYKVRVL